MEERTIYSDMARRTKGAVYIGVVGPVRTGKSTLIKRFMDTLVIPHMEDEALRERANDELPQSAAGRTIMTTEPKFIPEEAFEIRLPGEVSFRVRMIDCVGYIVPSAIGYIEGEEPRMVKTPWFDKEIPFHMAAELGTKKVITEHSTIGLVVTTDGSISDLPREEYREAEERVIRELQEINKPFIVLLNSLHPDAPETIQLAQEMEKRYGVPIERVSCADLTDEEICRILGRVLLEFPVKEIRIQLPRWVMDLQRDHPLRSSLQQAIRQASQGAEKLRQVSTMADEIARCEAVETAETCSADLGSGCTRMNITLKPHLFYEVLREKTGLAIGDEAQLLRAVTELSEMKQRLSRVEEAYRDVSDTGYGIVMPSMEELTLEEPEIIRQGGRYGIRLRATAPSVHMMKTNIQTEITPIVGSEQQSEELIAYLLKEFEEDPSKIWESNIFGKSLHELVNEGLHNKLSRMPSDAQNKVKETVERIINDGCNGLICIIL